MVESDITTTDSVKRRDFMFLLLKTFFLFGPAFSISYSGSVDTFHLPSKYSDIVNYITIKHVKLSFLFFCPPFAIVRIQGLSSSLPRAGLRGRMNRCPLVYGPAVEASFPLR
jgi:hypothetical protein